MPLNEVRNSFPVLEPSREYIVYCQSGRRSSAAAFLFAQRGFRVSLLRGGTMGRRPWPLARREAAQFLKSLLKIMEMGVECLPSRG